jgi:allantoin racemase
VRDDRKYEMAEPARNKSCVINVINPNTTASMTALIAQAAQASAGPGTRIVGRTSSFGPASIEGHYDEALATIGMLKAVTAGDAEGANAHVIACFGDPGLLAAREITSAPVLGIAEAAMRAASFVALHFSVVTTLSRTRVIAEHLLRNYGMRGLLLRECRDALDHDGIGAIVLGCAGMADLARDLSSELGIPVIDGVAAAVRFAEALVGLGLKTSKHGDLAFPIAKVRTPI